MATTSSTTKAKPDKQNLTRNKSINRKPKPPSSVSSEDGSDQKPPEKPLPNYLKPTISSRPDPVKLSKKNNNNNTLDDNQKLLRRRSFDRPSSSLTSPPSTSSTRNQKSLKVSPSLPRDKTVVPKEKPVTAQRSSSFHGSRGVPRGGTSSKSPLVAPKKSGLSSTSSSSTSLKSKKEVSEDVLAKKVSEKEIPLDIASLSSSAQDDEEVLKVESALKLEDDIGETKEDKEVQVDVVQADESVEENESGEQTMAASSVIDDCISVNREEDEELIKEDKTKEEIEQDNNKEDNVEVNEEAKKEIDEDETPKKVDIDMKEVESIKETTKEEEVKEEEKKKVKEEEKEKVKKEEKEKVKEEEKEKVKEEEKEKVKEEDGTREVIKKKEVVKGKKESPSAYNDVIASKIQENPRKNKVLALAGAFQTVIDYETAASK